MATPKIKPVNIDDSNKVIEKIKSLAEVAEFEVKTANEINRAIKEFNHAIALVAKPYDDTAIKKSIALIKSSMPIAFNDKAINKKIDEIKKSIPVEFNDASLKNEIKLIKVEISELIKASKSIKQLEDKIPSQYDDSKIIKMIESIKLEEPDDKDNSKIEELLSSALNEINLLKNEIIEIKSLTSSNQKEIRSNRKESGLKIDIVEQKLNVLTEIK